MTPADKLENRRTALLEKEGMALSDGKTPERAAALALIAVDGPPKPKQTALDLGPPNGR